MHEGPGGSGLSRKAILDKLDASVARLGTDYIDLYQIHRFDEQVPVEETMEALHDETWVSAASRTRRWARAGWPDRGGQHTRRGDTDRVAKTFDLDIDRPLVEAVQQVAEERGVPMAQIAIAWLLSKPVVSAPIVGATKTPSPR